MKLAVAIVSAALLGALEAAGGYVSGETLFEADFSSPEALAKWEGAKNAKLLENGGPDGKPALLFTCAKLDESALISIPLDPAKISGLIRLEASVAGENLQIAEKPYFGAKVMLSYNDGKTMRYPEPARSHGSFGWKKVSMVQQLDPGCHDLRLTLGIQRDAGVFRVANVRICRAVEVESAPGPAPVNEEAKTIPRGDFKGAKYRGVMSGSSLEEKDFADLESWGVNLMRYQMNAPKEKISTPEKYLAWIDEEAEKLDKKLLPLARKHGIKLVLDLHTGPGTEMSQVASNLLVDGNMAVDTLLKTWRKLAERFKGRPEIYGYDILNEPVVTNYVKGTPNPWQTLAERTVKEIREVDPDTPIIVEPDSDFNNLKPIDAKNIVYSPHFYSPHAFTHQQVLGKTRWSYPGEIDGTYWDKEQMRVDLKPVIEFQRAHNAKIFIGEFSAATWAPGADKYLADCVALFEEYGWDWTYHAFREWPGWSFEHEGSSPSTLKPSPDNPRKKVMLEAFKKNAESR